MTTLIQLLIMLLAVWYFVYQRARMQTVLGVATGVFIVTGLYLGFAPFIVLLLVIVWAFYLNDKVRITVLTRRLYRFFRKSLPPINSTELEAIEAGDTWWEAELFRGDPDWNKMRAYPIPSLSDQEQAFLDNQTNKLCGLLNDWDIVDKRKDLSPEAWDFIKDNKFLGMIIPVEYGGLGFSAVAHSAVVTRIATRSSSAAVDVMVPNSLGPAELLLKFGTQEQRDRYLPKLAIGEEVPCFALTSPEAGSDAGALIDKGVVCKGKYNGKEVLGLSLTWNKRYITLAPIATVLGLAFKMFDPDHLLGEKEELGITVALIPTDHSGVETGQRHNPMGMAFMNGPTSGDDVFIPLDWIIGGVENAGKGWKMLMTCLSEGRGISLPALSTATASLCYRYTGAYSKVRQQFNLEIGEFEGVEEALARIAGYTYLIESVRLMTAGAVDQHVKPSVVSAIAKYHMTELSRLIVRNAMDVHGGRGLILGERNYLAHCYISTPIAITVEGANILTRSLIIFGQGAIRCHPFIFKEMMEAQGDDEKSDLTTFDSLIFRHIGYSISNVFRAISMSVTGGRIASPPPGSKVPKYYQQIARMSAALALVSDVSMLLLGGKLKRRERLSARLGDVLSQLYMSCAVLKYFEDNGQPDSDIPYVEWNVTNALFECQRALNEFFDNLANRPVAWILEKLVFPFGAPYKKANDNLSETIVETMLVDCELRDRLTKHVYIGEEEDDPGFIVENAFNLLAQTKSTRHAIRKAMRDGVIEGSLNIEVVAKQATEKGVCSESESEHYVNAEQARDNAIRVDRFDLNLKATDLG